MSLLVEGIQSIRNKDYTPAYWLSFKKHDIKLFLWGIIIALLYKFTVGLIGVISGTMVLTIDKSAITKSIPIALASSFGFLGVALFEECLFRGYIMQVVFKKLPEVIGVTSQALIFALIHYSNYSVHSHTWIRIIDAALIGLIFGIIVIKTKSLMFVIGTHLFYDVAEQILFLDNSYKFNRFICFQNTNSLLSNLIRDLFSTEFIELIILSIIALLLIFLFRKDILYKKTNEYFLNN